MSSAWKRLSPVTDDVDGGRNGRVQDGLIVRVGDDDGCRGVCRLNELVVQPGQQLVQCWQEVGTLLPHHSVQLVKDPLCENELMLVDDE
ncbi:hypothetical protein GCM10027062_33340 [Nocardioides hungaricus]